MKNIATIFLMLSLSACAQPDVEPEVLKTSRYNSPKIDMDLAYTDLYEIDFSIEKSTPGMYYLVITLNSKGGSFYVSPHSKQDFSGKFRVELSENEFLELGSDFQEIPLSLEVIDKHPFVGGPVNWVDVKTTYKYPLVINSEEDFVIGADAVFTIEPRCTLENIHFKIFHSNGEVNIELGGC
jgi:hypothetical protein